MAKVQRVAIIGGGFSGVALAAALRRQSSEALHVTLIEASTSVGRGRAYGTTAPCHLLNTRAAQMSLDPTVPDDFVQWQRKRGREVHGDEFVARADYGDYLEQSFVEVCRRDSATKLDVQLQTAVVDVDRAGDGFVLALGDGRYLHADVVVLATGHGEAPAPMEGDMPSVPRYVRDPWSKGWLDEVRRDDRVLVLGAGLTAIDIVLALADRGHVAPIQLLSRRGLVPRAHPEHRQVLPRELHNAMLAALGANDLRTSVAAIRRTAAAAAERGLTWHAVIDALRPITPRLWNALCARDRQQFLRWVRPYWDAHRHRMAPAVAGWFDALHAAGRVQVTAGKLRAAHASDTQIAVEYLPRGAGATIRTAYDWVVNCTGNSFARGAAPPLERRLLERGLLLSDPLALGYVTAEDGAVIGQQGPVTGLYVLGPACRAAAWEHTAVPEIRAQVSLLAERLAARADARPWLVGGERPVPLPPWSSVTADKRRDTLGTI